MLDTSFNIVDEMEKNRRELEQAEDKERVQKYKQYIQEQGK